MCNTPSLLYYRSARTNICWRRMFNLHELVSISEKTSKRTVYPKKYAHGFCFAVLCFGYTLTDFPISIRLTSLALWQSNDCPNASKATLMNMDKYFMWIHYERLHNYNKAKHNKTVCIFLGIYCKLSQYPKGTVVRAKMFIPLKAGDLAAEYMPVSYIKLYQQLGVSELSIWIYWYLLLYPK